MHCLETYGRLFGVPNFLSHDRGKEFEGEVRKLCDQLQIQRVLSAPYTAHPQGAVERVNKELSNDLRRLRQQFLNTLWWHFIPVIHMKLRNAVYSSTNYSPNEIIRLINPIIGSLEQESISSAVSFNLFL